VKSRIKKIEKKLILNFVNFNVILVKGKINLLENEIFNISSKMLRKYKEEKYKTEININSSKKEIIHMEEKTFSLNCCSGRNKDVDKCLVI
jgi:hypothetical protein